MKKLFILSAALVIACVSIVVISAKSNANIFAISLENVEALANDNEGWPSTDTKCKDCRQGGPGSSKCEYSYNILGISQSGKVECKNGYYACCKILWNTDVSAVCCKE